MVFTRRPPTTTSRRRPAAAAAAWRDLPGFARAVLREAAGAFARARARAAPSSPQSMKEIGLLSNADHVLIGVPLGAVSAGNAGYRSVSVGPAAASVSPGAATRRARPVCAGTRRPPSRPAPA